MVSLIVPISGENPLRMRNFKAFLTCVVRQTVPCELIVVEEITAGSLSIYKKSLDDCQSQRRRMFLKHVVVPGEVFNKSWLLNIGAKNSVSNILVFMDGDVLFDPNYLEKIRNADTLPCQLGWSQAIFLSEAGSKEHLENGYEKHLCIVDRIVVPHPGSSSCMGLSNVFDRKFFFDELGGYNETYTGWGGEDCDIMKRALAAAGRWDQLDYTLYHLHHGGRVRGDRNTEMWNRTARSAEEVTRLILARGMGDPGGARQLEAES